MGGIFKAIDLVFAIIMCHAGLQAIPLVAIIYQ
jgi:hypothetical protein